MDNTFTCGVSGYFCEDSDSPSKLFCNETHFLQEDVWGDLGGNNTNISNSTAVWNETRSYVCANCDPAMKDFFYTIGKPISIILLCN